MDGVLGQYDLKPADQLPRCVMATDEERYAVEADIAGVEHVGLPQPAQGRNDSLDDEGTSRLKVSCSIDHACQLLIGIEEKVERAVDHIDKAVARGYPDGGKVAHDLSDSARPWLGSQPLQHGCRGVDAVDLETTICQRQGHPARPHPEFEHWPFSGQLDQRGNGGVSVRQGCRPLVVDRCEPIPERGGDVVPHKLSESIAPAGQGDGNDRVTRR